MDRLDISKAHAKNRTKIRKAITQLNLSLNQSIKENKKELEYANIRMIIILYAAYLEASLSYFLYLHDKKIKIISVNHIINKPSEYERWSEFVDFCFRRNYLDGKRKVLNLINLKHTNFTRYQYVKSLLDNEIRAIIEIRNKLAHGQWAVALNSEGDGKNQEITTRIWTLSKKDIMATKNIVIRFVELMDALISSKTNFSTSFDVVVGVLEETKVQHEAQYDFLLNEIKSKKRPVNV